MTIDGQKAAFNNLKGNRRIKMEKTGYSVTSKKDRKNTILVISQKEIPDVHAGEVALLLKNPPKGTGFPEVSIKTGKKTLKVNRQSIHDKWAWFSAELPDNKENITITVADRNWKGNSELWINSLQKRQPFSIQITLSGQVKKENLPPLPFPQNESRNYLLLKKGVL